MRLNYSDFRLMDDLREFAASLEKNNIISIETIRHDSLSYYTKFRIWFWD
jgi:hypothetical protein